METRLKGETFLGFVLRTGRYKIGANAVQTIKRANLVIVCRTASENAVKVAEKYSARFHCPLLKTKEKSLEELTGKLNAKIMAITDKDLSKAIIENAEGVFESENRS